MRDYAELVKALRVCGSAPYDCSDCPIESDKCNGVMSLFSKAADAIEELLAAVPKWISVDERLPDVAEKVITYNGNFVSENWLCTVASKVGKIKVWAYSEGFVTHWMPLPEPPKEVLPNGEV